MAAVLPLPQAHKIAAPKVLSAEDIAARRRSIISRYGSADELRARRNLIGLSLDERIALSKLADLDYLSGD